MDPTSHQYYQHHPSSSARSLSSTTDPRCQDPRYQQYLQSGQTPAGYSLQQSQAYEHGVPSSLYYPGDPRRGPGQSAPPSASYPGAVAQTHQMAYAGSHAASAPGALGYAAHSPTALTHAQAGAGGGAYHGQAGAHHASTSSYAAQHPPSSQYASRYFPTPAQSVGQLHAAGTGLVGGGHYAAAGAPPASPENERFACDKCDKTFSRQHDRKRHYESQHSTHPYLHRCRYCNKEFSRADSLKRHIDNGCEKDPSFQPE